MMVGVNVNEKQVQFVIAINMGMITGASLASVTDYSRLKSSYL